MAPPPARSSSAALLLLALVLAASSPAAQGVEKVKVELYSEALCPYCAEFIVNYLNPFFNNGIIDIVELRIIPYGNAHVDSSGTMVCQHGQDECDLNIIQTCAIRLWPKVSDWFPFIYCLESLDRSSAAKQWPSCVHSAKLDLAPLRECYESPLGARLELEFAAETDRLQPPHKYVPWVLVNGEPLYESYQDVATYVCKAYQGNKPPVCSRLLSETLDTRPPGRVCLKENSLLAST
jgi:interferon gamma-inducible protein 30